MLSVLIRSSFLTASLMSTRSLLVENTHHEDRSKCNYYEHFLDFSAHPFYFCVSFYSSSLKLCLIQSNISSTFEISILSHLKLKSGFLSIEHSSSCSSLLLYFVQSNNLISNSIINGVQVDTKHQQIIS